MTLVNFEGTLTTAPVYKTKNDFTLRLRLRMWKS